MITELLSNTLKRVMISNPEKAALVQEKPIDQTIQAMQRQFSLLLAGMFFRKKHNTKKQERTKD